MPRTSLGKLLDFRKPLLLKQKDIYYYDLMRFRYEELRRKNAEKIHPNGRPKC